MKPLQETILVASIAVVAIVLLAVAWKAAPLVPWAAFNTIPVDANGTAIGKAPIEIFALLFGPLGALAAVIGLFIAWKTADRNLQQSVRTERATRFQKAAELIATGKGVSVTAGLHLMEGLAGEDETFLTPFLNSLVYLLDDLDSAFKQTCSLFGRTDAPFDRPIDEANYLAFDALGSLAQVRNVGAPWPKAADDALTAGRLYIGRLFITEMHLPEVNLSATHLLNFVFKDVGFSRVDIRNSVWRGSVVDKALVFTECDLTNTVLHIKDRNQLLVSPASGLVEFVNSTKVDGLIVNGLAWVDWQAGRSVIPGVADSSVRKALNQE